MDGNEIRYEDYTRYNDALSRGISGWENLSGGVNIAPDSPWTVADLEIRDYNRNDGNCGYWTGRTGADLINLNVRFFGGYGTRDRRACSLHEWGHAHGLDHSYNDQAMDDCPVSACGSTYITPQSHDRGDYYYLW